MEKDKIKIFWLCCRVLLLFVSVTFIVLVWVLYLSPENYKDLCDSASSSGYYHFKIDDNDECNIRWMYLIKEPLLFSIVFVAFIFGILKLPKFWQK